MRRRRRYSIKQNLFFGSNFITNTSNVNNNNYKQSNYSMIKKFVSIVLNNINYHQCTLTLNNKHANFLKIILYKKLFFIINKIYLNKKNLLTYLIYNLINKKKKNYLSVKTTLKLKAFFIQFIIFTGILLMAFNIVNARVIDLITARIHKNNHSFIDQINNLKINRYRRENNDKTFYKQKSSSIIFNSKKIDSFKDIVVITSSGKIRGFKQV